MDVVEVGDAIPPNLSFLFNKRSASSVWKTIYFDIPSTTKQLGKVIEVQDFHSNKSHN